MRFLSLLGVGFFGLLLWGVSRSESYLPFAPHIDTRLAADFSVEGFTKVKPGMTEAEVLAAIGQPLYRYDCEKEMKTVCQDPILNTNRDQAYSRSWSYSNDGGCNGRCDMAWVGYTVLFDSTGKVASATRRVFYD